MSVKYYVRFDRPGRPSEIMETETSSAIKCRAMLEKTDTPTTITVFRKKTWEILSRVRFVESISGYVQVSHPKYMEDWQ